MTIQLSASLIKDYLTCHARAGYRITQKEEGIPSIEMLIGSAVHEVLEKCHLSYDMMVEEKSLIYSKYGITDNSDIAKADNFIQSFRNMFPEDFFSPEDLTEKYFKLLYDKGIYITGRIDRIHNGVIFDWKTTKNPPIDVNRDPQFILYYIAYRKMFKSVPKSVVYVALKQQKIYYYKYIASIVDEFEHAIIPEIVRDIRSGRFTRTGLFGYKSCDFCSFRKLCWSQLEY